MPSRRDSLSASYAPIRIALPWQHRLQALQTYEYGLSRRRLKSTRAIGSPYGTAVPSVVIAQSRDALLAGRLALALHLALALGLALALHLALALGLALTLRSALALGLALTLRGALAFGLRGALAFTLRGALALGLCLAFAVTLRLTLAFALGLGKRTGRTDAESGAEGGDGCDELEGLATAQSGLLGDRPFFFGHQGSLVEEIFNSATQP